MTHHALGAGPDGLVVHGDERGGAVLVEEVAVDGADAGDHAVGGGADAHFLDRHDAVPGGQDQLAHFDPGAFVDQFGQALALGQFALGVASFDPGLAILVLAGVKIVEELLQVGADVVEVDLRLFLADRLADIGLLDEGERVPFVDHVADGDGELAEVAADVGVDDVLHFHGVHHEHLLAFADGVALLDQDLDDRALERRGDRIRAGRSHDVGRRLRARRHRRDALPRSRA